MGLARWLLTLAMVSVSAPSLAQIASGPKDDESSAGEAESVSDEWLTAKVKTALLTTAGVPATRVHVDSVDSLVTLHGSVATASEKANAETAARGVQGMRDVRNLLQVVSASAEAAVAVSDEALTKRVAEALAADPSLAESRLTVLSVNKGVVLLSGSADSLSSHLRALEVASRVPGTKHVATQIESPDAFVDAELWHDGTYDLDLSKRSAAADQWITSAVKVRLFESNQTPTYDINVDTDHGVVTLFGVVDSKLALQAATDETLKIPGVTKVVNELQIVPPGKEAAVAEKDEVVSTAIEKRLAAKRGLADSAIVVEVKSGVARVSGTAKSQSDRLTALGVTRATRGVRGLVDDVEVVR